MKLLIILIYFRRYQLKDVHNSEINHQEVLLHITENVIYFITVSQ